MSGIEKSSLMLCILPDKHNFLSTYFSTKKIKYFYLNNAIINSTDKLPNHITAKKLSLEDYLHIY